MKVQNVKFKSYISLFGIGLDEKGETEQYITISNTGRVWFKAVGEKNTLRKICISIPKDKSEEILEMIKNVFEKSLVNCIAYDAGVWKMELNGIDGTVKKYDGSMIDECYEGVTSLCEEIRKTIPIEDLWLFNDEKNSRLKLS